MTDQSVDLVGYSASNFAGAAYQLRDILTASLNFSQKSTNLVQVFDSMEGVRHPYRKNHTRFAYALF